jgi:hypothetical protein
MDNLCAFSSTTSGSSPEALCTQRAIQFHASSFCIVPILLIILLSTILSAEDAPNAEPMELRFGHAFVQVMVNGKGPFSFLVDTGTSGEALVCPNLIEKLSLPASGEQEIGAPGQRPVKAPVYLVSSLKVAGVEFKNVKTARHEPFPNEADCDGILGFGLFYNYLLTLDYPRQQFVLSTGSLAAGASGTIPYKGKTPEIMLKIGSRQIDTDIDSGGMGLSLPEAFAKDLQFASDPIPLGRAQTGNGTSGFEIKGARLATNIEVAGYTFSQPFVETNPIFPVANFGSVPLRHFAVTFDQKNKLVRFASNERILTIDPPRMMIGPAPGAQPSPTKQ